MLLKNCSVNYKNNYKNATKVIVRNARNKLPTTKLKIVSPIYSIKDLFYGTPDDLMLWIECFKVYGVKVYSLLGAWSYLFKRFVLQRAFIRLKIQLYTCDSCNIWSSILFTSHFHDNNAVLNEPKGCVLWNVVCNLWVINMTLKSYQFRCGLQNVHDFSPLEINEYLSSCYWVYFQTAF